MNCPACHADAPSDAQFCPKCGASLVASAPLTAVEMFKDKVQKSAGQDDSEKQLWHGGFSPKAMLGYWLLAILVSIAAIVGGVFANRVVANQSAVWFGLIVAALAIWGGMFVYYLLQRYGIEYQLTSQRLIHRSGIFARSTNRIEVIDIDDVSYTQGFVERFTNVGTIKILSTDVTDPNLVLVGIDDVKTVADMIDKVRREERRKRGLHIETV